MVPYCQIEHVDSDSDVGTPCSNRAVAECADSESRFVLTVAHGVADSHSAKCVVITM